MAIQLNDRDHLIFKLIDEHEVLLEKHISWFIAGDDKPVLIRDRLRKLFYLDYLLCHRHGSKLPWWTTPTKPLVYMLSPMTRGLSGFADNQDELLSNDFQRHHLEVANLRMLYLVAQKDQQICDFAWKTIKAERHAETGLDAKATFNCGGSATRVGLVNNVQTDSVKAKLDKLASSLATENIEAVLLISRDEQDKNALQKTVLEFGGDLATKTFFATHQELYRDGIVGVGWVMANGQKAELFKQGEVTFMPGVAAAQSIAV
ncbi:MAG: hypothetical protein JSS86_09980 [Cyanobacteria bacterium SZAS LIN-2]|nr:hypothetical protein [Cyanobacteria bacterium SZAS LIN-2]